MSLEAFSLAGKVAVVTGAGRGLGFDIARTLQAAEADVVIAEIDVDNGRTAAEELGGTFVPLDVTDPASVKEMVDTVMEEKGRIDILVNNAGVVRNIPSEEASVEDWQSVRAVNLDGVFWCCREVGKIMLEQESGSIVNIASMSGMVSNHPQPQAAYNASKAGVITLTKSLAGEWAERGVRVNAVSPGYVATEMTKHGMSNEEWGKVWLEATPMGRLAEPSEISPAVVYLASEAASFTTGTNLVVDGGYTSW